MNIMLIYQKQELAADVEVTEQKKQKNKKNKSKRTTR